MIAKKENRRRQPAASKNSNKPIVPDPNGDNKLAAALGYAKLGHPVFPVYSIGSDGQCTCSQSACSDTGKHPRTQHGLKDATTDPITIKKWWEQWPDANIGLRTDDLLVIDIDPRHGGDDALNELEDRIGKLPDTVESLTGGGGRHLLFNRPSANVKSGNDRLGSGIDVKTGSGAYIVAPPSNHVSGKLYCWEQSSVLGEIPIADVPDGVVEQITATTVQSRGIERTEYPEAISAYSAYSAYSVPPVNDLIERTLPKRVGQRDDCIRELARGLKFNWKMDGKPFAEIRPHFCQWWERAKHVVGTKDFDTSWFSFTHTFDNARKQEELPAIASDYDSPDTRLLIAACYELQNLQGFAARGKLIPFSLSCSQVARELWGEADDPKVWESNRVKANRWLQGLCRDEVLRVMVPGKPGYAGSPATRYIYLPLLPGDADE